MLMLGCVILLNEKMLMTGCVILLNKKMLMIGCVILLNEKMLMIGCVILLWYSLGIPYNYFACHACCGCAVWIKLA